MSSNNKIFIQIAAYRDPQLIPTIKDCIENAKFPKNLIFCVAWQHSPDENIDELKKLKNVKIIDIPYMESKGACWARNRIQQEYDGEEYTLQLDSHHRFIKDWDDVLIKMYKQLQKMGHKKPLLTGYIPSFDPEKDPQSRVQVPWRMDFDRFIPEGAVFFLPAAMDNWKELTAPVPSRFYSAHFAFTTGKFCKEVQHDPEYYFHGEEISIAARAFTHGYDLFHPHRIIAWHEYTRKGRTKHWDDHSTSNTGKIPDRKDWGERNSICHRRNRILFSMDGEKYETIDWGKYGFGKVRTLRDYEKYAGLHFGKRAVQQETLDKVYPPNKYQKYKNETEWEESFLSIFKHCIDLQTESFKLNDYDFWCVAFEKSNGTQLARLDADKTEIERVLKDARDPKGDKYIKLWRTFNTSEKPDRWVVWPHSVSKGWCDKITGNL